MRNGYSVIDADTHFQPSAESVLPYLDGEFRFERIRDPNPATDFADFGRFKATAGTVVLTMTGSWNELLAWYASDSFSRTSRNRRPATPPPRI